jgi:hypothetical protein
VYSILDCIYFENELISVNFVVFGVHLPWIQICWSKADVQRQCNFTETN